jgi:hypothetical protein
VSLQCSALQYSAGPTPGHELLGHELPTQKTNPNNGSYSVTHANFVVAYTEDNLGHVIYPGGVTEDDWIHDLLEFYFGL